MRYDWTPLWRSTIGFDHLFDVLDEVQRTAEESYPPYNIERLDENRFQISVALAGFTPDELSTEAAVTLEPEGKGFKISKSALTLRAKVPNLDDAGFAKIAGEAEKNCPVSKVLNAAITLDAKLI